MPNFVKSLCMSRNTCQTSRGVRSSSKAIYQIDGKEIEINLPNTMNFFQENFTRQYLFLPQILASELESDLRDTVDWGKKWLVDFNAGKTQLVSFDRSKNTCAIV